MNTYRIVDTFGAEEVEVCFECTCCAATQNSLGSGRLESGACPFCLGTGRSRHGSCASCRGTGLCPECLGKPRRRWEELSFGAQLDCLENFESTYEQLLKLYREY